MSKLAFILVIFGYRNIFQLSLWYQKTYFKPEEDAFLTRSHSWAVRLLILFNRDWELIFKLYFKANRQNVLLTLCHQSAAAHQQRCLFSCRTFVRPTFASIAPLIRSLHSPEAVPALFHPVCGQLPQSCSTEWWALWRNHRTAAHSWNLTVLRRALWLCCHCAVEEEVWEFPQRNKPIYQGAARCRLRCFRFEKHVLGICQLPLLLIITEVREPHVCERHIHTGGISATSSSHQSHVCQTEIKTAI